MGSRSARKATIQVFLAFLEQTTWNQAALARRCEISVKALRPHLLAMQAEGVPLESEPDDEKPGVLWTVPNGWFPGGATLEGADLETLSRFVARSPSVPSRNRLLSRLARFQKLVLVPSTRLAAIAEHKLDALETAHAHARKLALRYHSAESGEVRDELISVHAIDYGERLRFVVTRADGKLRWLVGAGIESASVTSEHAAQVSAEIVQAYLDESVDGFHSGAAAPYEFFVRLPESRWVVRNLPHPLRATTVDGGVVVRGESAALPVIARFVVGLGDAARVTTPELRAEVERLARGALRSNAALGKGRMRAVGSKRGTG